MTQDDYYERRQGVLESYIGDLADTISKRVDEVVNRLDSTEARLIQLTNRVYDLDQKQSVPENCNHICGMSGVDGYVERDRFIPVVDDHCKGHFRYSFSFCPICGKKLK